MNRYFSEGREFSRIEAMFPPARFGGPLPALGDDCHLFREGNALWAVTADAAAEGVHFNLEWIDAGAALEKAVLANLSDLNAVGAAPAKIFLGLGASPRWRDATYRSLGRVLRRMEGKYGFRVCGGDTVTTVGGAFFAITAMGPLRGRPLLRSAARPGHRVYVSGTLGDAAAGLRLLYKRSKRLPERPLTKRTAAEATLIRRFHRPDPPLALGPALAGGKRPVAAIDISDGLSSEAWHLSRQSGCRIVLEEAALPRSRELESALGTWSGARLALHGGEDFQLLFTGRFSRAELTRLGKLAPIREIGSVVEGSGVSLVSHRSGSERELKPGGWTH